AAFFAVLLPAGWTPGADVAAGAPLHDRYVQATTVSFLAIVACQVGTAMASRCDRASLRAVGITSNPLLLWGIAAELGFALAVVYLPPLQHVFGTGAISPAHLAMPLPCPLLVWGSDELYRWASRTRTPPSGQNPQPPPSRHPQAAPPASVAMSPRAGDSTGVGRDVQPSPLTGTVARQVWHLGRRLGPVRPTVDLEKGPTCPGAIEMSRRGLTCPTAGSIRLARPWGAHDRDGKEATGALGRPDHVSVVRGIRGPSAPRRHHGRYRTRQGRTGHGLGRGPA
ncbi:MAG: cation-translocating P-type ATPase C-terminal domain-containing protein, partial [Frankiaceae bacterium]